MRSRTVDAAGTPLEVHEWGERGGAELVFWHALGDHTGLQLAEVAPILAAEPGAYVVSIDAPGFGASPPLAAAEDYRLANISRLALAAAQALGLERPALAGASWGGSLALAAAATAPDGCAASRPSTAATSRRPLPRRRSPSFRLTGAASRGFAGPRGTPGGRRRVRRSRA